MDTNTHNDGLDRPLATLRTAMDEVNAPRCVEKELMAAFARQHARPRWYKRIPRPAFAGAGALAMLAVAAVLVLKAPLPAVDGPQLVQRDEGRLFIALDSLERIEGEPDPRMIETEVPRMELASLGIPLTPENAGETVHAEMLVSADGEPLALRLTSKE